MPAEISRTQVVDCTCKVKRPHGDPTAHTYNFHKCGCHVCRDEQRKNRKIREYQTAMGKGPMVDAKPVADYILNLRKRGMVYREVSELSGVNVTALHRIYTGKAKKVYRWKAEAIRSIPLPSHDGVVLNGGKSK